MTEVNCRCVCRLGIPAVLGIVTVHVILANEERSIHSCPYLVMSKEWGESSLVGSLARGGLNVL